MINANEANGINYPYYTSYLFLINFVFLLYYKYYFYASLFGFLFLSSLLFHLNNTNIYIDILDKIAILLIIFYGGSIVYKKIKKCNCEDKYFTCFIIIFSFLFVIFLFNYGFMSNLYCYDDDTNIANLYHSYLHLLSSIGHICIILL